MLVLSHQMPSSSSEYAVPDGLEAGRIVAFKIEIRHPGDGLRLTGERLFGEFFHNTFKLPDFEWTGFGAFAVLKFFPDAVVGEATVIGVFPAGVIRVVHIFDPVIFEAFELHDVFAQVGDAAGKRLVNHRILHRIENGDVHGAVDAERITGFVVLGFKAGAMFVKSGQRLFIRLGKGFGFDSDHGNIFRHRLSPVNRRIV